MNYFKLNGDRTYITDRAGNCFPIVKTEVITTWVSCGGDSWTKFFFVQDGRVFEKKYRDWSNNDDDDFVEIAVFPQDLDIGFADNTMSDYSIVVDYVDDKLIIKTLD